MKILMTGFTAAHVGNRTRYGYQAASTILPRALISAGHLVEQRPVAPGEDLTVYDRIVVGICSPINLAANYHVGALYAIQSADWRGQLSFYVDDWRLRDITNQISGLARRDSDGYYVAHSDFLNRRPDIGWARENASVLRNAILIMASLELPSLLLPAFDWGDHSLLLRELRGVRAKKTTFADLSPEIESFAVSEPSRDRRREWLSAALPAKSIRGWQESRIGRDKMRWPVNEYPKKGAVTREVDIVARCAESRGVLCLPYPHMGSGWWRVRYSYAAARGAVLLTAPGDCPMESYLLTPELVESMSDAELDDLADRQRKELASKSWSGDQLIDELAVWLG